MIDWIKARLPWDGPQVCGGHLIRVTPDGEIERSRTLVAQARGSFDESFTLRTCEAGFLEVDGNPSKFLQGHNLFGAAALAPLTHAATVKALRLVGLPDPSDFVQMQWRRGMFDLLRVDVTESFALDSAADVRAWIAAAGETASMKWKGRATMTSGTLYFGKVASGKRASPWSMKIYAKGDELAVNRKGHRLPFGLPARDELTEWASNILRVEVLLRASELNRKGGRDDWTRASTWTEDFALAIFWRYFEKMQLGEAVMLEAKELDGMKPYLKAAYNLWLAGGDLRGIYKRPTVYRYRRELLELTDGRVDIFARVSAGNVVPLRRVLELKPAPVPNWAQSRQVLWTARQQ